MKTLFLVRHAKSDWEDQDISDIDRPLNKRGYKDAHTMGALLKEKKLLPDLIITSPAIRALTTALILGRNFNLSIENIIINPNLYGTNVKHYIDCITQIDNRYDSIMLLGHNPIITELANTLSPQITQNFPTCAIAGISQADGNMEWKTFNIKTGKLFLYEFPKKH